MRPMEKCERHMSVIASTRAKEPRDLAREMAPAARRVSPVVTECCDLARRPRTIRNNHRDTRAQLNYETNEAREPEPIDSYQPVPRVDAHELRRLARRVVLAIGVAPASWRGKKTRHLEKVGGVNRTKLISQGAVVLNWGPSVARPSSVMPSPEQRRRRRPRGIAWPRLRFHRRAAVARR